MRKILAVSYVPWKYRHGESSEKLRTALAEKFQAKAFLFASGRESLLALLKAIRLKAGEEVIIQGYTCVVLPNAIHAAGGVPIYADIDEQTLNLTPASVEACITPRTRAVICQHTFGIPSDTKALREICDRYKILLIEDCAHILPSPLPAGRQANPLSRVERGDVSAQTNSSQEIGKLGDVILLSFGRDKAISGIAGGGIVVRNASLAREVELLEKTASDVSLREIIALLEYGPRMRCIVRPLIALGLHRPILKILNGLGLFAPILTERERKGCASPLLRKIPNACAFLTLHSLSRLKAINDHRRDLTTFYLDYGLRHGWPLLSGVQDHLPMQKFPLFVSNASHVRAELRRQNIHLDDGWTGCVICPDTVEPHDAGYEEKMDPVAEKACLQILSLPTHPTMTMMQAQKLTRLIDDFFKQQLPQARRPAAESK